MLILAGISINAIVGDNGILNRAEDAVYLNSCACLSEYFNQLYASCAIDGNDNGETPLDTIMQNGYQNYFFKTAEGYCLKKNYMNQDTGEVQTLVLYLVQKEQLPEEIRGQLSSGDNLESRDYRKLKGVYGITSDLKAYYCKDSIDTILGLTVNELNADSPDIVYADENSILAQMVNEGTSAITNQGLKAIKILTIDSQEEIAVIKEFSNFPNLTTLNIKNVTIDSLEGIEGASNSLTYIKIRNCSIQNYSSMNGLVNLKELYLVRPVDKDAEIERFCSIDNGIANGEFSQLEYFGIVGGEEENAVTTHDDYLNNISTEFCGTRYGITNINGLSNFSDVTKQAIKYMNLQNLQLTSIASLKDFSNVYFLRLENNALATLDGIQNMNNLHYLIAPIQYSNILKTHTLGKDELSTASNTDALNYIFKQNNTNTNLYYVDLRSNNVLKNVGYLNTCTGVEYLYLAGCNAIADAGKIKDVVNNCGSNYSMEGKYGSELVSNVSKTLKMTGEVTVNEFESLMNNKNLTQLSLFGITLKNGATTLTNTTTPTFNEEINKVLSTCTSLENLQLYNLGNLTTIDFVGAGKVEKLIELDLRGTKVTNLISLNNYSQNLRSIHLDNTGIDITTIQPTISRCKGVEIIGEALVDETTNYWCGGAGGCNLYKWELIYQLENCTEITYFRTYNNSWASLTNGKSLNLTNTKLKAFFSSYNRGKLYLPSTLEEIEQDGNVLPIFSDDLSNLKKVSIWKVRALATEEEWTTFINSLTNASNLSLIKFGVNQNFKFEMLSVLGNLNKLESFEYFVGDGWTYDSNKTSITGLGALKNLKSLTIKDLKNVKDMSDLATCTKLEKISITNTQISDTSALKNMSNLIECDLSNNQINSIYYLKNCTKLESLNLRDNALNNFGYYKNEEGKSIAYEALDILYDLNYKKRGSLKYLDISNNVFDDTEIISDLDWPEGKEGF